MNNENSKIILEKYQDVWQELYQEFSYAFQDYNEFILTINELLNRDNLLDNMSKDYYINNIKKQLRSIISYNLKANKISILLNYITSNIVISNEALKEIKKFVNWLNSFNYAPSPNIIIDLIEQSPIFKGLLQIIVDSNIDKIKKYGLEKVLSDNLIVLFVDIYCTLNNIDLNNNKLETTIDSEEEDSINILKEQQNIMSSYKEDSENNRDFYPSSKNKEYIMPDYMPTGADAFIKEIKNKKLDVLTKEQECDLLIKIQNGDEEAYKYFYEHNCRLVINIAARYRKLNVDYEDLIQEGCIGLMIAIDKFEVERGLKFSTYATWWIKQAVLRALSRYNKKTGVSFNKNNDLILYKKNVAMYADELGRWPTDQELAEHFDMSLFAIQENNQLLLADCSINQKVSEDSELGEFIEDENIKVESESIINNLVSEIQELFKKAGLTEQEITILNNRWGLNNCEEKTLSDVGEMFGFTRERARQHEAKAIKKLRKYVGTQDFALYLDEPEKAIENLKKLTNWHSNNPKSYTVHDIDVSTLENEEKQKTKEVSFKTKKARKENHLYKLFKDYKKAEIDAVVETLSQEERRIINIRNDYFNNPNLYSAWNNETIKKEYKSIISKISYRLKNDEHNVKVPTIYDLAFSKKYSKEEINLAVNMLEAQDKKIITLRYGLDLENPVISNEWDFQKYGDILYEIVIPHIIDNLKLINEQNKEIETKIINIYNNEEMDDFIKEMYIKALRLIKLPEVKIILQGFSLKESLIFALYLLKYFEDINFNIEDFMDVLVVNKEGLNACINKSLIFMKEHLNELAILKDKLYYNEEKKLSRK